MIALAQRYLSVTHEPTTAKDPQRICWHSGYCAFWTDDFNAIHFMEMPIAMLNIKSGQWCQVPNQVFVCPICNNLLKEMTVRAWEKDVDEFLESEAGADFKHLKRFLKLVRGKCLAGEEGGPKGAYRRWAEKQK